MAILISTFPAVLLGFSVFSGTAADGLGERFGGISSMRWDPQSGELLALSDRGPGDGAKDYAPRFHVLAPDEDGRLGLKRSVPFRDASDSLFTGLSSSTRARLDPEGLALAPDGTLYVSEEYGPSLLHFDREGRLIERLDAPSEFLPGEGRGRLDNQGLEGLCATPSGRRLAALMQGPLAQEGGERGRSVRLLLYDLPLSSAPPRSYLLDRLDPASLPGMGLDQGAITYHEIEALSENEFLVLERDNRGLGSGRGPAAYKALWRVALEPGPRARKEPYLDLVDALSRAGFKPESLPSKFESVAWGPRGELWISADNDFKPDVPTFFFRFAAQPR